MAPSSPLYLDEGTSFDLLTRFGPSLALWRAAEVAMLRRQHFIPPILDAGCGDGIVTSHVLPTVDIGLDPGVPGGREAVYRSFINTALEDAPLPDASLGTILSNSVIEHVADVDAFLQAAARLLRPGGSLILTTPSEHFSRWLTLPSARYAAWRNGALAHRTLWPAGCWAERLTKAGLQVVAAEPYLRRPLVTLWDALELTQQVWIGDRRLASLIWKRLPPHLMHRLAAMLAACDLGADGRGGGQLIVAQKAG